MSKYTKQQLTNLLQGCSSLQQAADKLGITKQAFQQQCKKHKVDLTKKYWPLDNVKK